MGSGRKLAAMLSLGKMAAGQERYYTDAVAQGREDYYLGKGGGARPLARSGSRRAGPPRRGRR